MKKTLLILHFFVFNFLLNAQTNLDFEATPVGSYTAANAVSGWTVSSNTFTGNNCGITNCTPGSPEFSIVSTPFAFPVIGVIPQSPLGGNKVARLNSSTANFMKTKLAQNFTVTTSNSLFQFAYAGVWQDGGLSHHQNYFDKCLQCLSIKCFGNNSKFLQ